MTTIVPAKKGDLAVVRRIGDGSGAMRVKPLIRWYVGRVTKVDRETGYVREFEYPAIGGLQKQAVGDRGWGGGLDPYGVFVASSRDVKVDETIEAARAHSYPGHPGQPMPFDTVEDAKKVVVVDYSPRA